MSDADGVTANAPTVPVLEVADVSVRFGGIEALKSVSFEVWLDETVALIGPNGAGKTTLLDVIAGARRPTSGSTSLVGQGMAGMTSVRRARLGIARTFQQLSPLPGLTVWEHVLLGFSTTQGSHRRVYGMRRSSLDQRARGDNSVLGPLELLDVLGIADVADKLATDQSVGTVRMVDLARALASRPRLLLLDEPVSGLSEHEALAVVEVIERIHRDHPLTILVVEHNLEFARAVARRAVALDFGRVIGTGATADVLSSPRVHEAYFGAVPAESQVAPEGLPVRERAPQAS